MVHRDSTSEPNPTDRPKALALPTIDGIRHIRVPVSDVVASSDWYAETLGFRPILMTEQDDSVVGVVMRHPSGVVVGLHCAPHQAKALAGFAVIGLAVSDLDPWSAYLNAIGVAHSGIVDGHLGQCIRVRGPGGMVVELHTPPEPSADDA